MQMGLYLYSVVFFYVAMAQKQAGVHQLKKNIFFRKGT